MRKTLRICAPDGFEHFIFVHKSAVFAFNEEHCDKSTFLVRCKFHNLFFFLEMLADSGGKIFILRVNAAKYNSRRSVTFFLLEVEMEYLEDFLRCGDHLVIEYNLQ